MISLKYIIYIICRKREKKLRKWPLFSFWAKWIEKMIFYSAFHSFFDEKRMNAFFFFCFSQKNASKNVRNKAKETRKTLQNRWKQRFITSFLSLFNSKEAALRLSIVKGALRHPQKKSSSLTESVFFSSANPMTKGLLR